MRWLLTAVGLVMTLGSRDEPLGAQGRVRAGAGAGIAMPSGTLQDQSNPGWRAVAALDVWLPDMPTSLRVDVAYDRFGLKSASDASTEPGTGSRTIASAALSLSVGSSDSLSKVSPYALAGVTMNHIRCVGTSSGTSAGRVECAAASQMGWTAGIGTRFILLGRRGFADARMHCVLRWVKDLCYIPVTVGLLFWSHEATVVDPSSDGR
jgi:opacity protein-like surface antigen